MTPTRMFAATLALTGTLFAIIPRAANASEAQSVKAETRPMQDAGIPSGKLEGARNEERKGDPINCALVASGAGEPELAFGPTTVDGRAVLAAVAVCSSTEPFGQPYAVSVRLSFQVASNPLGSWSDISGSSVTCSTNSVLGQAAMPCTHFTTTPDCTGWLRGKLDLESPVDQPPSFTQPWPCSLVL